MISHLRHQYLFALLNFDLACDQWSILIFHLDYFNLFFYFIDSALDDVYCCETCNVYGLASEFLSERFCTQACSAAFTVKKAWQYRREQDLRALRLRRKKRRLEQQRQAREKAEEDIKIEDEKSEVSPMQKVLYTMPVMLYKRSFLYVQQNEIQRGLFCTLHDINLITGFEEDKNCCTRKYV